MQAAKKLISFEFRQNFGLYANNIYFLKISNDFSNFYCISFSGFVSPLFMIK